MTGIKKNENFALLREQPKGAVHRFSTPKKLLLEKTGDTLSFTSNPVNSFGKKVDKALKMTTFTNADKIISDIDDILGDKYFSKLLKKADIEIINNELNIKNRTIGHDLWTTLKYPIVNLPFDIAASILNFANKGPFKKITQPLLNTKLLSKRIQNAEIEKSYNKIRDIIDAYAPDEGMDKSIEKYSKKFREKTTSSITTTFKNYNSRDERTLNRMATSTVSAIYSSNDFYNISMLQKDDDKEAKEAQSARFKQEITRMGLSAATTFLTLGALDRYIKKSVWKNAAVIALSALISEVGSRLFNKTPLYPLTPKEAEKIALKDKTTKEMLQQDKTSKPPLLNEDEQKKIFSQFTKNGTFASIKCMRENAGTPDKKKFLTLKNILLLMTGISSGFYLITKGAKGEYSKKIGHKNLYKKYSKHLEDFANNKIQELNPKIKDAINLISQEKKNKSYKYGYFERFKNLVTVKKVEVDLPVLLDKIKELKKMPESKGAEKILDEYKKHIEAIMYDLDGGTSTITVKTERFLTPGVYEGVTKIIKTLYQIFSIPAAIINGVADRTFFKKSNEIVGAVEEKLNSNNESKYKNEIAHLAKICLNKPFLQNSEKADKKAVETIIKNTRNFETGAETGELANLSRTMVTAITTYFFVNDYTNKVLIESAGKNVKEAKEERNERIAHKLSNFVINGTLMNLFNSVFKTPLNNSLINAVAIASATETTNEFLVRKSICQPIKRMSSKQAIIDYETKQQERKGLMGSWSRLFKKITGKKSLSEKVDAK